MHPQDIPAHPPYALVLGLVLALNRPAFRLRIRDQWLRKGGYPLYHSCALIKRPPAIAQIPYFWRVISWGCRIVSWVGYLRIPPTQHHLGMPLLGKGDTAVSSSVVRVQVLRFGS
jgi:hypothetical protein